MTDLSMTIGKVEWFWDQIVCHWQWWYSIPVTIDPTDRLAVVGWFKRAYPTEYMRLRTLYRLIGG